MKLYVLDFESYWDQDYTLKKLTTDGYVLDPRFKAHGLGIRGPSGQLEWVRGPDIPAALQRIDWANAAVCAHNTAFDGFILTQRYGCPQPKWWLDTMSMARGVFGPDVSASLKEVAGRLGLGVKGDAVEQTKGLTVLPPDVETSLAEYCLNDVELCYRVLAKLRSRVPAIEMKLIDLTLRMFVRPRVWLDEQMLERNLRTEVQRKDELMARLGVTKAQLNSADQLAELFARMGVTAPTKPSPKDPKKRIYAFAKNDPEFQELLEDERDEVRWLAEARLGVRSTIEESRTGRLLQVAKDERPWPVLLHYYGAHTGRWSGGNKQNPQNLGRKSVLRQSVTAPQGYVIGVADSSQIECRTTARVSGQQSLLDIFRAKGDPYSTFASKLFRRIVTKADKLERQVGKVCLTGDTLVITNRGIVPLLTVSRKDLVWDGREWVSHGGLVCNGEMPVLRAWGIGATAGHEILTEHGWREWSEVRTSRRLFRSALRSATSPSSTGDDTSHPAAGTTGTTRSAGASAGGRGLWKRPACDRDEARSATPARESLQLASVSGSTRARCPTTRTEFACSIDSRQRSLAATTHATRRTATMESVASSWPKSGVAIAQRFSATCKRFLAGMTQILRWIGRTSTGAMCPATSASSLAGRTSRTSGASPVSNSECASSRQSSPVFDLVNCGPRNRFTVLSTEGPIVVHNCILGFEFGMGWAKASAGFLSGAITQGYGPIVFDRNAASTFGADPRWLTRPEVQASLRTIPKTITLADLAVHALAVNMLVSTWRSENPFTVNYWYYLNDLIPHMAAGGRAVTDFFTIEAKGVTLPNGMRIEYHGLRERGGDWFYLNRRKPTKLYGGKMLENVVQALARIVVAEQMVRIAERYETVMMTHDEVVFLMPEREADEGMQWALDIMHTPPRWMPDLPVAAEGGYAARYADAKS